MINRRHCEIHMQSNNILILYKHNIVLGTCQLLFHSINQHMINIIFYIYFHVLFLSGEVYLLFQQYYSTVYLILLFNIYFIAYCLNDSHIYDFLYSYSVNAYLFAFYALFYLLFCRILTVQLIKTYYNVFCSL